MTTENPYSAPSAAAPRSAVPLARWKVGVLVLVGLQLLLALMDTPRVLSLFRSGDINFITAAPAALATVVFAVGGLVFVKRPGGARRFFAGSALLGIVVLLQWPTALAFTGLAISLVACFVGGLLSRGSAQA